jgi:hypothetical protein
MMPLSALLPQLEADEAFVTDAMRELDRINSNLKVKSTYTRASAVDALLNHWLVERELDCYERGRIVEDVCAATVLDSDIGRGIDAIEDSWKIELKSLRELLHLKGLNAPACIKEPDARIIGRFEPPEGDALIKAQELKARKGRLTITEAIQTLIAKAEFINISTAVKAGEIPSYAPGSNKRLVGNTDNFSDDEELLPAELNAWLKEKHSHVDFRFPKVGDGETVVNRRKRAALITEVKLYWPTISDDLRHSDSNGLAAAASLPEHGYWDIDAATNWARERGKLIEAKTPPAPSDVSPWAIATGNLQK